MNPLSKSSSTHSRWSKWLAPLIVFALMLLLSLFFLIYQLSYTQQLQIHSYELQNRAMALRLASDLEQGNVGAAVNQTNNLAQDKRMTKMMLFDHQLNQIHSWPFSQRMSPPDLSAEISLWQKEHWLKQEILFKNKVKGYLYTQISFDDALFHAQKGLYFGILLSFIFTFISVLFMSRNHQFYRQFVQQLSLLMREFNPSAGTHAKAHQYYPLEMFKQDFEALLKEVKTREVHQNETMAQLEKRKAMAETIIETRLAHFNA